MAKLQRSDVFSENFPGDIFDAFSTVRVREILVTTDRQTLTILFGKMTANCHAASLFPIARDSTKTITQTLLVSNAPHGCEGAILKVALMQ